MTQFFGLFFCGLVLVALDNQMAPCASIAQIVEPPKWKPGDGWPIQVRSLGPNGKERSYEMHMVVTAIQKQGTGDCWRLELIPIRAPAELGTGYRILIDCKTGYLTAINSRMDSSELKLKMLTGLPILHNPPPGFPLEFLALLEARVHQSQDGKSSLEIKKWQEGKCVVCEAILIQQGKKKVVIKQRWFEGEKWWHQSERYVDDQKDLYAWAPEAQKAHMKRQLESPKVAKKTETRRERSTVSPEQVLLRRDVKLGMKISVSETDPKLDDLFERLGKATGLHLVLADNLTDHDPKFGDVKLPEVKAWMVMEMIAMRDLDHGRWVKTADGYRLEGVSRALRTPLAKSYGWAWATGGTLLALATAGGAVVIYRRRGKQPAASPSKEVAQARGSAAKKKPA